MDVRGSFMDVRRSFIKFTEGVARFLDERRSAESVAAYKERVAPTSSRGGLVLA